MNKIKKIANAGCLFIAIFASIIIMNSCEGYKDTPSQKEDVGDITSFKNQLPSSEALTDAERDYINKQKKEYEEAIKE